ncbi:MAG: hypothetical protein D6705_02280 [Deltaproteobacteria bacterium]|nr:MAG: hypothetical protein D6705_02280 [Deltaproteobacteria bacterium]
MAEGSPSAPTPHVPLGVVTAPHGIRGAVRIRLAAPDAPLPGIGATVRFVRDGSVVCAAEVSRIGPVPGRPLARMEVVGVTSREAAVALVGAQVEVDRDDLPPLDEDEFYLADAVGARVAGKVGGRTRDDLGVVVAVVDAGPRPLLEVRCAAGRTWFLSPEPAYVRDVSATEIVVDLPEGMGPEDARPGRRKEGGP